MIIFLDTSAWIKFFINEVGTEELQNFMLNYSQNPQNKLGASAVTYAEMFATFKRSCNSHRITEEGLEKIGIEFQGQWEKADIAKVNDELIHLSGKLAKTYSLKGCDAFQLASAIFLEPALFISSDDDLSNAAKTERFQVWDPNKDTSPVI